MPRALPRTLRRTAVGSALLVSLVAGLLAVPAAAAPGDDIPDATDCPATIPTSALTVGMTGQGLTVVKGATPQPFAVEIVGVLDDGIGAGRDMIIIEASDLPGRNVISAGGGIWAGMSGSPVYIDGKLLGAVSYGFSASPSPIGGVTPAADMSTCSVCRARPPRVRRPPPRRRPPRSRCRRPSGRRSTPGPPPQYRGGLSRCCRCRCR